MSGPHTASAGRAGPDPVTAHLAELDRALLGPARTRRSMVREAGDGMRDAAAAYRHGGMDPQRADRLAVRDFGPVPEVAALYQEELAAGQGRRTALLLALCLPALTLGWDLLWRNGVEWGAPPVPAESAMRVLARVQDVASGVVALAALGLLLLTFRRTRSPRRVAAGTAAVALLAVVVCGGTAVLMHVLNAAEAWQLLTTRPPAAAAYLASLTVLVLLHRSALRTVRALRGPAPDPRVR